MASRPNGSAATASYSEVISRDKNPYCYSDLGYGAIARLSASGNQALSQSRVIENTVLKSFNPTTGMYAMQKAIIYDNKTGTSRYFVTTGSVSGSSNLGRGGTGLAVLTDIPSVDGTQEYLYGQTVWWFRTYCISTSNGRVYSFNLKLPAKSGSDTIWMDANFGPGLENSGIWKYGSTAAQQRGSYIDRVSSTSSTAYPINGQSGGYWYTQI